jgi:hypothetical protein
VRGAKALDGKRVRILFGCTTRGGDVFTKGEEGTFRKLGTVRCEFRTDDGRRLSADHMRAEDFRVVGAPVGEDAKAQKALRKRRKRDAHQDLDLRVAAAVADERRHWRSTLGGWLLTEASRPGHVVERLRALLADPCPACEGDPGASVAPLCPGHRAEYDAYMERCSADADPGSRRGCGT